VAAGIKDMQMVFGKFLEHDGDDARFTDYLVGLGIVAKHAHSLARAVVSKWSALLAQGGAKNENVAQGKHSTKKAALFEYVALAHNLDALVNLPGVGKQYAADLTVRSRGRFADAEAMTRQSTTDHRPRGSPRSPRCLQSSFRSEKGVKGLSRRILRTLLVSTRWGPMTPQVM
jgi:hypothetical protein